jgi:hypothetical protein
LVSLLFLVLLLFPPLALSVVVALALGRLWLLRLAAAYVCLFFSLLGFLFLLGLAGHGCQLVLLALGLLLGFGCLPLLYLSCRFYRVYAPLNLFFSASLDIFVFCIKKGESWQAYPLKI